MICVELTSRPCIRLPCRSGWPDAKWGRIMLPMRGNISDNQMAQYWRKRVAELESMRPIMRDEAVARAEAEEAEAQACQNRLNEASAQESLVERGRVAKNDSLAARGMRNNQHVAACRESVWGEETRKLQHQGMAAAMRKLADSPIGVPLAEALAEAKQRLAHYESLVAAK